MRLGAGAVYPALQGLEAEGVVRSWTVVPGGARGARSRRYYELTVQGIRLAREESECLAGLVEPVGGAKPSRPEELDRLLENLRAGAELSEEGMELLERTRAMKGQLS
jgi:DNA-binding PadR family transcriptional regulator